jgi:hypothetical protein
MDDRDRLVEGEKMLDRFNNGAKVSQLCEEFGYSKQTIHNRLSAAIKERIAPTVDEYREAQSALLDDQMVKVQEQLDAVDKLVMLGMEQKDATLIDKAMSQRAKAIELRSKVAEQRAKLMGLNRPLVVEATVTLVQSGVDAELERLSGELGVTAPVHAEQQVNP